MVKPLHVYIILGHNWQIQMGHFCMNKHLHNNLKTHQEKRELFNIQPCQPSLNANVIS